jgi:hypothetical protein
MRVLQRAKEARVGGENDGGCGAFKLNSTISKLASRYSNSTKPKVARR